MGCQLIVNCPLRSNYLEEVRWSIRFRSVSLVIGIFLFLSSIFVFQGLLGLNHLNFLEIGMISTGALLSVTSLFLKCVKRKSPFLTNIFPSSQAGCIGKIDKVNYGGYLRKLIQKAPKSVTFQLDGDIEDIEGGVCSAKVLTFLDGYMSSGKTVKDYFSNSIHLFIRSSLKDRTLQAALNSITVLDANVPDIEKDKIQALLNFNDIRIQNASETMCLEKINNCVSETLGSIEDGTYFVRAWKKTNNHKLELHGHSTALIKLEDNFFVYAPNFGLHTTSSPSKLFDFFQSQHRTFDIPNFRLYKCTKCVLR